MLWRWKAPAVKDELAAYQLVGEVMAHQGDRRVAGLRG